MLSTLNYRPEEYNHSDAAIIPPLAFCRRFRAKLIIRIQLLLTFQMRCYFGFEPLLQSNPLQFQNHRNNRNHRKKSIIRESRSPHLNLLVEKFPEGNEEYFNLPDKEIPAA